MFKGLASFCFKKVPYDGPYNKISIWDPSDISAYLMEEFNVYGPCPFCYGVKIAFSIFSISQSKHWKNLYSFGELWKNVGNRFVFDLVKLRSPAVITLTAVFINPHSS